MIGFNIHFDNIAGMQVACANDYGVTVMAYKPSDDLRCMFSTCAIGIAKVASTTFTDDDGEQVFNIEDKTLEVMEKMGYQPTATELEEKLFLDVNISKFFEVMEIVNKLEVH